MTPDDTAPDDTAPVQGPSRTGADLPPPPDDVIAAARSVPDHWLSVVDPTWSGDASPPQWALLGAWRTDAAGTVVEWRGNDAHRPSPRSLGWPEPGDQLDGLAQRVATGYAPVEVLVGVLAASDVVVLVRPDGGPVTLQTLDGAPAVAVFSSEVHADAAGAFAQRVVPVRELLDEVPDDHVLLLNPAAQAVLSIDSAAVRERITGQE